MVGFVAKCVKASFKGTYYSLNTSFDHLASQTFTNRNAQSTDHLRSKMEHISSMQGTQLALSCTVHVFPLYASVLNMIGVVNKIPSTKLLHGSNHSAQILCQMVVNVLLLTLAKLYYQLWIQTGTSMYISKSELSSKVMTKLCNRLRV